MSDSFCPICGSREGFVALKAREREICRGCRSFSRARVSFLAICQLGLALRLEYGSEPPLRIAHFAPEPCLFNALNMFCGNPAYRAFDVAPEEYDFAEGCISHLDLATATDEIAPGSLDLIVHNHVLEHVRAPFEDVLNWLNSRLAPGGWHLFTLPVGKGRFREHLDPAASPEELLALFGQDDHVRVFGEDDVIGQLQSVFGTADVRYRPAFHMTQPMAEMFGIEPAFLADAEDRLGGNTVFWYRRPDD